MTNQAVALLIEAMAEIAVIEGMKAENYNRDRQGLAQAYGEDQFGERATSLFYLSNCAAQLPAAE